ncbi:MAG: protein translocase subunit SecF [Clostridia bacterium]
MNKKWQNFEIAKNYKVWFIIPAVIMLFTIILVGGLSIARKSVGEGMNVGIDFTGGTILTVELDRTDVNDNYQAHVDKITKIVETNGGDINYVQKGGANTGETASIIVKFKADNSDELNNKIKLEVDNAYENKAITNVKFIGPTASKDLIATAVLSVVVSIVLILIYVIIRFEVWSGISAIVALIHDVLMMLCFTLIFQIPINSSFVAAMITIVSYSINDTIVIFDRVRENQKIYGANAKMTNRQLCDVSVKQTLTRSINTTLTTLFAITLLAIIGASSIKEFAMPIIFGLFAGMYSSIFISPSFYCLIKNKFTGEFFNQGKLANGKGDKAGKKKKVKA